MPSTYQTPIVPLTSSASSPVTPPVRPPPFPYQVPFLAPPSVGQVYLPVRQPPFQHPALYPLQPTPVAYPPAPWPPYPQVQWETYLLYYPYQQGGNDEDSETARYHAAFRHGIT